MKKRLKNRCQNKLKTVGASSCEHSNKVVLFCRAKKGQITAFIIIGIILLLITSVVLIFRSRASVVKPEAFLDPEIIPVYQFVQSCAEQLANRGARIIGANGGYAEVPDEIRFNPRSYLPVSPIPNARMPYWWYDGISREPTQEFLEFQLKRYVEKGLPDCLQNFTNFQNQFTMQQGAPNAQITLTDEAILVKLSMPLNATNFANKQFKIQDYETTVPVRLKKAFELAKQIMDKENENQFFEKLTIDLMSMNSDVPTTDIEFRCAPKNWLVSDVKKALKEILRVNLPLIKVDKTAYTPIPADQPYMLTHYIWPATESQSDMIVGITFDDRWPFDMSVRPSDGIIMRSNAMKGQEYLSWVCVHMWHFTYDANYPLMISINDPEASGHKAFTFTFPFKVSINHNAPERANLATEMFNLPPTPESSQFCRERLQNELNVFTTNNVTQEDVSGVNITYTCLKFTCDMGASKFVPGTPIAELNGEATKFPMCINGILRGHGDGFEDAEQFISTEKQKDVTLYLTPSKKMQDYDAVKFILTPLGATAASRQLGSDDIAAISIKDTESNFQSFVMYPKQSDELPPLKLLADADKTYEVTIYLTKGDNLIGGYQANWTVSWDQLKEANSVRFNVLEFPAGLTDDQTAQHLINMTELSKLIPEPQLVSK